ncbi:KaiC domain-containing protein [Caminibacter pacificus]|uniref:KaiC domain protein n=1 Tax=Caminibacter pacificus TaxID=1424653 RepID=A0AAJ4UXD6_9BACT|nr:KaiC domain-containing protein [Caminibacter pacificus]QCI28777.1 KaiC domain-containing protein [Caminibacter pacificus]ROR39365.1 KaiC domain protein [Caminibacter pacificus]
MEKEIITDSIITAKEALKKAPKLEGITTGIEGLDNLFFTAVIENNKPQKKPLGGMPKYSVCNITGINDTGKSLMAEQFAIHRAQYEKVCFVTVETPANYVVASMKLRAAAMGVDAKVIDENIIFIDATSHYKLRDEIPTFLNTLAYAIKEYDIKDVVIDSITGFFENKEMMARTIVRMIYNFLKKWYQTSILVSQKRSGHDLLSSEAAGGYAVGHIVDGTIVLSKEVIDSSYKAKMYKKPIGEIIRLFRIDGCRMSGHDTKVRTLEITDTGIVKIGNPIGGES